MSAIKKWFDIFYEDYICLNLRSYSNIGVDFEIVKLMLAVALGIVVCGILLDYYNNHTYALIKQLLRHDAVSESKAKTLGELGLGEVKAIRRALATSGKVTSIVARVGERQLSYEEYTKLETEYKKARKLDKSITEEQFFGAEINFDDARFYVREEQKEYAVRIFNGADVSVTRTALRSALIAIVTVIIVFLTPGMLSLINSLLG